MKLALFVAAVAAQRYNNNNNNNNNSQQGGYGSGYGDPHFMVKTPGQEQLCFDFSPATDKPITLIADPVSALTVTAATFGKKEARTHMTEIEIMSPGGAQVSISSDAITSMTDAELTHSDKLSAYTQADLTCKKFETPEKVHYHCQVENGPAFEIRSHHGHHSLAFAVHDTTGLSEKTRGIIGRFVKTDGYAIIPNDATTAAVATEGKQYNAIMHHFHHAEECWTLKKSEVDALFN